MTLEKSARLMKLNLEQQCPATKNYTSRLYPNFCRVGEELKATAKAVQNIPIAKPSVYTNITICRGIPCFPLTGLEI